jgi:hypothetical protein|uniref:hypothetical protein n=1 Tax=Cephaloticoccus sp. TaxID=1985742 RepID=UPI004048FF0A
MKSRILSGILLVIGFSLNVVGQSPPPQESQQFDFWIGEWNVITLEGKAAGHE